MTNYVRGTSTPTSVPPPRLGELRQHVLAALFGNPLFNEAEQWRANHVVHECEDVDRLTHWHVHVCTELAPRKATAVRQCSNQTRDAVLRIVNLWGHRLHRPGVVLPREFDASLPDRTDYRTGAFNRCAAAHFRPVDALTGHYSLRRQPR